MNKIIVDTNIIIDILTNDTHWYVWSSQTLLELEKENMLVINPVIYSELSINFKSVKELDETIQEFGFRYEEIDKAAHFVAGKAFKKYKRAGGNKKLPLPDFFIGAHAEIKKYKLLTRDNSRYLNYFPKVKTISPTSQKL